MPQPWLRDLEAKLFEVYPDPRFLQLKSRNIVKFCFKKATNPETEINFVNPTSVRNFLAHAFKNVSEFFQLFAAKGLDVILNKQKKKTKSININFLSVHTNLYRF